VNSPPCGPAARWRACLFLLPILLAPLASPAAEVLSRQQQYEQELIEQTLRRLGLEPEPSPEGKIIDRIIVDRHPIIEKSDPWPDWLNWFHVLTGEQTIRRELLFTEGQPYREELVRESERNLRALPLVLSVVRLVAARGRRPEEVAVVVITKDLWSLRLNSNFSFGGGVFNFLSLKPTEQNFLGRAEQLSLYSYIDRDTFSVGQAYQIPRLWGSRLYTAESINLRINHQEGSLEGGFGYGALWLPLVSLSDRWGMSLGVSLDRGVSRAYRGRELLEQCYQLAEGEVCLPWKWNYGYTETWSQAVRSFGERHKLNLIFGYSLRWQDYRLPEESQQLPAEARRRFEQEVLPRSQQASEVQLGISYFLAEYLRLHNIQSYGLSEDFRRGPRASVQAALAHPALGPGLQLRAFRLRADLGWLFVIGEDLLSIAVAGEARYLPDYQPPQGQTSLWLDRYWEVGVENVSPELLGLGRLHFRLRWAALQFDTRGRRFFLGGDNTLRGFVSDFQNGERLLNFNLEFRSLPVVMWTLHWGVVVFYDAGDAYGYSAADAFSYHHSLGLGIRGLFPQFDLEVFRLDVGIPLGQDFHSRIIEWVTVSFRQAF